MISKEHYDFIGLYLSLMSIFKNYTFLLLLLLTQCYSCFSQCKPFSYLEQEITLRGTEFGALDIGDIDNDNDLDLILLGLGNKGFATYKNDGTGKFTMHDDSSFGQGYTVKFIDVNNDGSLDLFFTNFGHSKKLFLNDGLGNFTKDTLTIFSADINQTAFAFGDIDNDGDEDLFIIGSQATGNNKTALIYKNDSTGKFIKSKVDSIKGVGFGKTIIADFNGDKFKDILVCGEESSTIVTTKLYLNYKDSTPGKFTLQANTPFDSAKISSISVSDFESDGDLDLLLSYVNGYNKIYINDARGNFSELVSPSFIKAEIGASSFIDINHDGHQDVILAGLTTASTTNKTISKIYINDTLGNFMEYDNLIGEFAPAIGVNDVNNDGYDDVLIMGFALDETGEFEEISRTRVYLNNYIDTTVTYHENSLFSNSIGARYNWISCNNSNALVDFENNKSFQNPPQGSFAVVVNKNECIDTSTCYSFTPSSLEEISNAILLHPNPTNGIVNIQLETAFPIETKIYNAFGMLVKTDFISGPSKIQLPNPVGVYFIELKYNNQHYSFKIIKY